MSGLRLRLTPENFCECEHEEHMDEREAESWHRYGVQLSGPVHVVDTPYGEFALCPACLRAGHMQARTFLPELQKEVNP